MESKVEATEFGKLIPRGDGSKVITVILGSDENPSYRKDFHCTSCGRIVFNYYTETNIIIVGEMREVKRPQDIMCSRCKVIFRVA